ncbi:PO21 protein, partial [Chloroceryle aenea]|nr:PO21 protein [Chloroceryle aenea]
TYIDTKNGQSDNINIKVGVKQGNPMSPILLNLSMDPLLCMLEEKGDGFVLGNMKVTPMALADDLVLLSDSWDGMARNIRILEKFCDLTGLSIQAKK